MLKLRDYQDELLDQVQKKLRPNGARVMMQLPTGGGKTVIAGFLLADWLRNGRKAAWITHRKELVDQTRKMLNEDANIPAMPNPQWHPGTAALAQSQGVVIFMAQTVGRRMQKAAVWGEYTKDDLLVVDEAHHAPADGWERAIEQWPGRILGMTATPWRTSEQEGFNHLFDELVCGLQTADLQAESHLCQARVQMPPDIQRIRGGKVVAGDYTPGGIEAANAREVMTARALDFWQEQAGGRQTIIYAVSIGHAENLLAVFKAQGIPTALLLGETSLDKRARYIAAFRQKTLKVLVNVAVATEGFDLPDASCVILARPTKSLSLYLQMVGRGLRPKADGGDCLILDLAGNALEHGLPEERRHWSLWSRGKQAGGDAPVIWCEQCRTVSPAAAHQCSNCNAPFGEDCDRCGKWRAWKHWEWETLCGEAHDLVCDLCHKDAHVQATLPGCQYAESQGLAEEAEERRRLQTETETRRQSLRDKIATREAALADDDILDDMFADYLNGLPAEQRPKRRYENNLLYTRWIPRLRKECAAWKTELTQLESLFEEDSLSHSPAESRTGPSELDVEVEAGPDTTPTEPQYETDGGSRGKKERVRLESNRPANNDKGSVPLPDPAEEKRRFLTALEKEYVAGNFMPTLESIRAFLKAEGSHDQVRSRRYARNTVMRYLEHRDLKNLYELVQRGPLAPAKTLSGIAEAIENAADRKRKGAAAPQKAPKEAARRRNSSKKKNVADIKNREIDEAIQAIIGERSKAPRKDQLYTFVLTHLGVRTRGQPRDKFAKRITRRIYTLKSQGIVTIEKGTKNALVKLAKKTAYSN